MDEGRCEEGYFLTISPLDLVGMFRFPTSLMSKQKKIHRVYIPNYLHGDSDMQ